MRKDMDEVLASTQLSYTGKIQSGPAAFGTSHQSLSPYLPDDDLIEVVNLTIYLQRPLLIKGEPGCGKTRLARAVAYELSLPYEAWHIKSTSRARDGLYTYDTVGRLRDAQLAASGHLKDEDMSRIENPDSYVR